MTPALALLLLRLGGAALLLALVALVLWYLYQDVRQTRLASSVQAANLGALRVINSTSGGPSPDTRYDLQPFTTIGRSARNTIVLDEGYVSAEHALLAWRDAKWWLEDLGSRNGTLLNDTPLAEPAVVTPGDVVTIGSVQLKLEAAANGDRA